MIWPATSRTWYLRTSVNRSKGSVTPYGLLRNASVRAASGLAAACAWEKAALNVSFWPSSSSFSRVGGRCAIQLADTSTTPGSATAATIRRSNATARVIQ